MSKTKEIKLLSLHRGRVAASPVTVYTPGEDYSEVIVP